MADMEGLWKFVLQMPGYGELKSILEIDLEDEPSLYFCINDQIETDLYDIEVTADILKAKGDILGSEILLNLNFDENLVYGSLIRGSEQIEIKGYRLDQGNKTGLGFEQIEYDKAKEFLMNREIPKITGLSQQEIFTKVEAILQKMTLDEKIGQLYQIPGSGALTGPDIDLGDPIDLIKKGRVGSLLGSWTPHRAYCIQKIAVEESRLRIPVMFMSDVIHGLRTIFPIPLATASSWDLEMIEKSARVATIESAVTGINLTFAPMVDIARDPRWGRIMEGAGEDPFLGSQCARAFVRGFQGTDLYKKDTIIACVKHYAAYGAPDGGRDYNTVDVSEYRLRNYYLPPYKAAVDEGVGCLMSSFNSILGFPSTGNYHILNEILRKEWNFKGMVISDYNSVIEMVAHGVAKNGAEAAELAIKASLDIEMVSQAYISNLHHLVENGAVDISLIDQAVRRILFYKYALGLFDDPYRYMDPKGCEDLHLCSKHRQIAREVARKSIILLENKCIKEIESPILPLNSKKLDKFNKIALIGPFCEEKGVIGEWFASGDTNEAIDLKSGILQKISEISKRTGKSIELLTAKGCEIQGDSRKNFQEALIIAKNADVVFLALGENQRMSGEAKSRANLNLPGLQEDIAREIRILGKPTVLILFNGHSLILKWFKDNMDSILETWFLGTESGNAIADVIFGDYNPSGKLTVSFPYSVGQIPVYYNHYSTGRPQLDPKHHVGYGTKYIDIPNEPLYPFGYGLSYTEFQYSNLILSSNQLNHGENITVSVEVQNIGEMAGDEVVQMYIQDIVASCVRPVKELKGFKKIFLKPNEKKEVVFNISEELLSFYNLKNELITEPGDFNVFVGSSSVKNLKSTFKLI